MAKSNKDKLFERMGLVSPDKKAVNENYPAGAEHDPAAPWNQPDPPEFTGYDVLSNQQNPPYYWIRANSNTAGTKEFEIEDLLDSIEDEGLRNYFENSTITREALDSPEFLQMIDKLFKAAVDTHDIEWEGGEDEGPDPDMYRDDMEENSVTEEPVLNEGRPFEPMTLIRKAITSKFIKPDEYFSNTQQMEDVAEETADYYASDDGHGFGSSDMTAAMKSFLDGMGYQTDYVNGRLTRLDLPEIQEDDDKWIQKAVNPDHEGYCTPMTKPTCTPARKAFAKRAKAGDLEESSAFTPLDGRDLGSKHAHAAHQAFAAQHGTDKSMEEYGQFLYAYAEGVNEAIDEVLHQGGGDWDLNPDNGDDGFLESVRQKISEYEGDGVDYDSWQSIPQANQAQFMQQAKQVGMTPQELYNQMRGEEQQDDARMGGPTTAMVDEHHLKTRQEKEAYLTNFLDVAVEGFFDELSDEELEQLYQYTEENGDLPPDYRGDAESGFVESVRQKISEYDEKFRAEVTGKGENRWSGNAMEYDTEEEAKEWLNNLANRWFGFDMSRVVPVSMPTGQPVDMENDIIYQNFRG